VQAEVLNQKGLAPKVRPASKVGGLHQNPFLARHSLAGLAPKFAFESELQTSNLNYERLRTNRSFLDQLGAARRADHAAGAGHHPFDRLPNLCDVMPHLRHYRYEVVTTIKAP
jgi:hypothetical protein